MTAQSSALDLVGAVLNGRWRLVRMIGEGGMGAVFEADGPPGTGKRAIKLLHQEFVKEEIILARFFAESQATKNFVHPNVAQVLETATAEDGTPYLVMELLQGIPVSSYTDQGQALPTPQAVHIVHGTLQALAAAHARGLVHRDVKPDNLFLVHDANGSFHVKVLDFGIAKVMDVAGGMGQKTRTGVLLGTPGYMSPEQIKDSKGVDARADLWSVGIIFYELLAGTSPFPADNEFARLTSVLTEEIVPVEQVSPHLASWAPFFHRALAKEPAYRFQSADEMAAALLAAARAPSLRAPPTLQGPQQAQAAQPQPDWRQSQVPAADQARRATPTPPGVNQTAAMPLVTMGSPERSLQAPPIERPSGIGPSPVSGIAPSSLMATPPMAMSALPSPALAATQKALAQPNPAFAPRGATLASTPPPALPSHVIGNGANVGPTHLSAQSPGGAVAHHAPMPSISVIDAPSRPVGMAPYWVVGLVAFVAFGLGLALGILIG